MALSPGFTELLSARDHLRKALNLLHRTDQWHARGNVEAALDQVSLEIETRCAASRGVPAST